MPIWKLSPIDAGDPSWEASSHRGVVIVRAPDEDAAREEAQKRFGVKTAFPPGQGVKAPPWRRGHLARAQIIKDERYAPEGPSEVLFPTFDADLQPQSRKS